MSSSPGKETQLLHSTLSWLISARVSLGQIRYLSLPIEEATAIATLLLPILTGITIQASQASLTHSPGATSKPGSPPSWLFPSLFLLLTVYETVIATLAFTNMLPSDTLTCQLSNRWQSLFHNHDVDSIRRIQDTHRCCGFRNARDRAWPFPDHHGANACRTTYHRERSCLGSWTRDQQVNAGLSLLVALLCFAVKVRSLHSFSSGNAFSTLLDEQNNLNLRRQVTLLFLYRNRNPWTQHLRHGYPALTHTDHDDEHHINHRADETAGGPRGRIEPSYHDNNDSDDATDDAVPAATEGARREDRYSSMAVQPSSIHGSGNEWRT